MLLLGLLVTPGCVLTQTVVRKANVQDKTNADGKVEETVEKPAWLLLTPFTVVGDVVTAPVQAGILLATFHEGH